jgi:hypothetical protein
MPLAHARIINPQKQKHKTSTKWHGKYNVSFAAGKEKL